MFLFPPLSFVQLLTEASLSRQHFSIRLSLIFFLLMLELLSQVVDYAKTFLDSHSLETLYYGNLSKGQARQLTGIQFHFQYISIFGWSEVEERSLTKKYEKNLTAILMAPHPF